MDRIYRMSRIKKKFQFYLGFLRARKAGFFREQATEVELHLPAGCIISIKWGKAHLAPVE